MSSYKNIHHVGLACFSIQTSFRVIQRGAAVQNTSAALCSTQTSQGIMWYPWCRQKAGWGVLTPQTGCIACAMGVGMQEDAVLQKGLLIHSRCRQQKRAPLLNRRRRKHWLWEKRKHDCFKVQSRGRPCFYVTGFLHRGEKKKRV